MSEIKYGQRVNIDPDATYSGSAIPTFLYTTHDPKGEYVLAGGPDREGDLYIVQRVGGEDALLWAKERFVTPYVEHETPRGGVH